MSYSILQDPSVYEHKADSWLRQHLNTIKQNTRRASETGGDQQLGVTVEPMDAYQMRRGYTADVIQRRPKAKKEAFTTPKMERKSKFLIDSFQSCQYVHVQPF